MTNWCTVRMFLNFDLLELDELGASGLQMQTTSRLVYPAILTWAHHQRHERSRIDSLVSFGTTLVTSVGGNLKDSLSKQFEFPFKIDIIDYVIVPEA